MGGGIPADPPLPACPATHQDPLLLVGVKAGPREAQFVTSLLWPSTKLLTDPGPSLPSASGWLPTVKQFPPWPLVGIIRGAFEQNDAGPHLRSLHLRFWAQEPQHQHGGLRASAQMLPLLGWPGFPAPGHPPSQDTPHSSLDHFGNSALLSLLEGCGCLDQTHLEESLGVEKEGG